LLLLLEKHKEFMQCPRHMRQVISSSSFCRRLCWHDRCTDLQDPLLLLLLLLSHQMLRTVVHPSNIGSVT
jgi:hypothetical protein